LNEFKRECIESPKFIEYHQNDKLEERIEIGLLTLHSWGDVIYYGNSQNQLIVLNPDWLSKMISKLTLYEIGNEGQFSSNEAKIIWSNKQLYPEHLYPSFLSLLEEFKLIVKLEEKEKENIYFIPSKLDKEQPKHEEINQWWPITTHFDKTIGRKYKFKVNIPIGLFHAFMTEILRTSITDLQNKGETHHYWNRNYSQFFSRKILFYLYLDK
jgi:hypothetical protein